MMEAYYTLHRDPPAPDQDGPPTSNDALTQDGAALIFAERHKDALRYCHDEGCWFNWTGSYWRRDNTKLAFEWARQLARELSEDESRKDRLVASTTSFAGGVETFARSDRALATTSEQWDRDPWLLGTPDGTVDLLAGKLRASNPDDCITRTTAVAPIEKADCPLWLKFLDESTHSDSELIRFLQQWCGYGLTGETREHALVFVYGPGGNGKSVFLNTVTRIMADYAATAAMDTFIASSFGDKHPTDLAMLRGARVVTASETEEGRAWAEARIKQMTGGDPISARFMRQDFFTYTPQFKLTIIGNNRPVLRNVDEAARRRFNIVPFVVKPANPDRELESKLRAEWPGILRWMIDGCADWQAHGLTVPSSVKEATEAYFSEQDLMGQWIEDECEAVPGYQSLWDTSAILFDAWSEYAAKAAEQPGNRKAFGQAMQRRGFEPGRKTGGTRCFYGIRLKAKPSRDSNSDA